MDRIFEDTTPVNRNVIEKGMLLTNVFTKSDWTFTIEL